MISNTTRTSPNPVLTIHALLRNPSAGREQLVAFQNDRLRRVIHHAYHKVANYRALFDREALKPDDIRTVDDLVAIPISSRSDLQD